MRDLTVTGVQTCALPISREAGRRDPRGTSLAFRGQDEPRDRGSAPAQRRKALAVQLEGDSSRVTDAQDERPIRDPFADLARRDVLLAHPPVVHAHSYPRQL